MKRTSKVELRGRYVLAFILMLCLCGCNTMNDKAEYETKVKVATTAEQIPPYSKEESVSEDSGAPEYSIDLNQVGYRKKDRKIAVVSNNNGVDQYQVIDGSGNTVYKGNLTAPKWDQASCGIVQYADFSMFTEPGSYVLLCGDELYSDEFEIGDDVYEDYYGPIGTYFSDTLEKSKEYSAGANPEGIKAWLSDKEQQLDVTGGWYSLSNRGQYIVESTTTIDSLFLLYDSYQLENLTQSEKENLNIDSLLTLVKQELTWLLKLQNSQGGVYHKVTVRDVNDSDQTLVVSPVSTCATADFAAVMAKAYRYFEKKDWDFANKCLTAAYQAWSYLQNHTDSKAFKNPDGVTTPEYTDDDDWDERFWAALELGLTTKRPEFVTYVAEHIYPDLDLSFTWKNVAGNAIMDGVRKGEDILSTNTYNQMQELMQANVNVLKGHVDTTLNQINYKSDVSFQSIISEGITLYLMAKEENSKDLCNNAKIYLDYLMGANPDSENYIGESEHLCDSEMDYVAKASLLLVGVNEFK